MLVHVMLMRNSVSGYYTKSFLPAIAHPPHTKLARRFTVDKSLHVVLCPLQLFQKCLDQLLWLLQCIITKRF